MVATVGWQAQLQPTTINPELIFRIRRDGSGTDGQIVFQDSDSRFLGASVSPVSSEFSTTINHTENPIPAIVGIFQQYFLTAELTGATGNAIIKGPVNLTGVTFGFVHTYKIEEKSNN